MCVYVYYVYVCVWVHALFMHTLHYAHPERWALSVCVFISICMWMPVVFLTHVLVLGPVSLRQYELVYSILARKQEFLVNFKALSHRNLRGI